MVVSICNQYLLYFFFFLDWNYSSVTVNNGIKMWLSHDILICMFELSGCVISQVIQSLYLRRKMPNVMWWTRSFLHMYVCLFPLEMSVFDVVFVSFWCSLIIFFKNQSSLSLLKSITGSSWSGCSWMALYL